MARDFPRRPDAQPVWGTDLVCPVSAERVRQMRLFAAAKPWPGNQPLRDPRHHLHTTAITEPGRPVSLLFSFDIGYHQSGWFANADYEQNWHLSLTHPKPVTRIHRVPQDLGGGQMVGKDLETPTLDEVRAWARVFFAQHHAKAWLEPEASVFDPYRMPNIVHARVFVDRGGRPFIPHGEPYNLRPLGDSPPKILEGRAGADVR